MASNPETTVARPNLLARFDTISRSANAIAPLPNGATRIIGTINYPRTYGVSVKFQI